MALADGAGHLGGAGVGGDPGQRAQRVGGGGDPAQASGSPAPPQPLAEELLGEAHPAEGSGREIEADHGEVEARGLPATRASSTDEDSLTSTLPSAPSMASMRKSHVEAVASCARRSRQRRTVRIPDPSSRGVPTCDPFPSFPPKLAFG